MSYEIQPLTELQVRNAANVIVQPEYGDDGMDPVCMEGKNGEPVALKQKMSVVRALTPKAHSSEHTPLPSAFRAVVAEELAAMAALPASNGAALFSSAAFADSLEAFLDEQASPPLLPGISDPRPAENDLH